MSRSVLILTAMLLSGALNVPGLVEVPANGAQGNTMAVLYTGDGGWRTTDRGLASVLANNGIPVVGINTLHYFWKRRTPEGAAEDFEQVLAHYLSVWKKDRVVVIGYSFGADVLPFILSRIPTSLLTHVDLLVLIAPTRSVDFEFHVTQWLPGHTPKKSSPVLPELQRLGSLKVASFCGDQDGEALCRDLPPNAPKVIIPQASHRFDQYYGLVSQYILKEVQK